MAQFTSSNCNYCIIVPKKTSEHKPCFHVVVPQKFSLYDSSTDALSSEIKADICIMENDTLMNVMHCTHYITILKFPPTSNPSEHRGRIIETICSTYGFYNFDMYEYWDFNSSAMIPLSISWMMRRVFRNDFTQFFIISKSPVSQTKVPSPDYWGSILSDHNF